MIVSLRNGLFSVLLLSGCAKGDKAAAYLDLRSFSVSTTVGQGSSSSSIPHGWIYVNDQLIGVWEAGSSVPVLASGPVEVKVIAGVERNGASADLVQYPYYQVWSSTTDLAVGRHDVLEPVFQYQSDLEIWYTDFEDPDIPFTFDLESDTDMVQWAAAAYPDDVMPNEGNAAAFFIDTDHPRMKAISFESVDFEGQRTCWLELNYRCDHRMLIGVYYDRGGLTSNDPYLFIAPTLQPDGSMAWKKIHIDLTPLTNDPSTNNRKFYISAQLDPGRTSGRFFIDNVKLVHP